MLLATTSNSPEGMTSGGSPISRLALALLATLVLTAALLSGVLVLVNSANAWRGLLPAVVVATISAAVSLVPLALGIRSTKPERVMGAFILAGMVRMVVTLGGGMLAVSVGGYPLQATMLLLVAFYVAVLAVEATLLGKFLWGLKPERT